MQLATFPNVHTNLHNSFSTLAPPLSTFHPAFHQFHSFLLSLCVSASLSPLYFFIGKPHHLTPQGCFLPATAALLHQIVYMNLYESGSDSLSPGSPSAIRAGDGEQRNIVQCLLHLSALWGDGGYSPTGESPTFKAG